MDENKREHELKELSHAIVDALTHNADVMEMLTDLKERKVIDSTTLLGLALKISDLLEISGMAFTHEDIAPETGDKKDRTIEKPAEKKAVEAHQPEKIDGRKLSKSEIAFQEWTNAQFDEKEWLKGQGLIW